MSVTLLAGAKLLLLVQSAGAVVAGTVRDAASGQPVAAAVVTFTELRWSAVTDAMGRYVLHGLPAGPWHLSLDALGYAPHTIHVLVPGSGRVYVDVAMDPAPIPLRGIEIRRRVPVRGLDPPVAAADRSVSGATLRNHPLSAEPDAFRALAGGSVGALPESPAGLHVHGGAADQTAFLLDGIPILNPYHATFLFSTWNPDAVAGVRLHASAPTFALPAALSGTVEGATRAPGRRLGIQATASTAQTRATVDGTVGDGAAGFVVALRSAFPGTVRPNREESYVRGESGDGLARIDASVLGGYLLVLGYQSEDELSVVAGQPDAGARNTFEWGGGSVGLVWTRPLAGAGVMRVRVWRAETTAAATWDTLSPAGALLAASRRDVGLAVEVEAGPERTRSGVGLRVEHLRTRFRSTPVSGGSPWSAAAAEPIATVFAERRVPLPADLWLDAGLGMTLAAGLARTAPRARIGWAPGGAFQAEVTYARSHQFAQSLRNAESIVGTLFPADLFVAADGARVPVARSDLATLGAEWRPADGARVAVEAWVRDFSGLVLAATRTVDPFATSGFDTGSGAGRGIAIDGGLRSARVGLTASHGWQSIRLLSGSGAHVPGYAARHRSDLGIILFPSTTASIRIGATAEHGRRATGILGALEWEACNLLDQGCEFGGSPRAAPEAVGAVRLPAYVRLDLGARKHWHFQMAGRAAEIALFATVTNVLGRQNVLGYATDDTTGESAPVAMRPFAPLVVGIDWRY